MSNMTRIYKNKHSAETEFETNGNRAKKILDILERSLAIYFYKSCSILRSPEETNDAQKYLVILQKKISNKIFNIQRYQTFHCVLRVSIVWQRASWEILTLLYIESLAMNIAVKVHNISSRISYDVASFLFGTKLSFWGDKNKKNAGSPSA